MKAKVSVIIPTYNSINTIKECINSVIHQSYTNLELIIVDDGSSDSTVAECKKILVASSLAYKIIEKDNDGPSSARNLGIETSSGNFIAFLDSDDVWDPEKLSISVKVLESSDSIGIVGSLCREKKSAKEEYIKVTVNKLLISNVFPTSSVVLRKSLLDNYNLQFDKKLKYSEDYDLWIRILKYSDGILINRKLLVCGNGKRGFGVSGLSKNIYKMQKGELTVISENFYRGYINFIQFIWAFVYSNIKFIRRFVICNFLD